MIVIFLVRVGRRLRRWLCMSWGMRLLLLCRVVTLSRKKRTCVSSGAVSLNSIYMVSGLFDAAFRCEFVVDYIADDIFGSSSRADFRAFGCS